MVRYVVDTVDKKGARVRATPSNHGSVIGTYEEDKVFEGERVPGFVKVKDSPLGPEAFIFVDDTREVEPSLTPVKMFPAQHRNFCILVTSAAREYGPDRDYLMAVAYHASNKLHQDMGTVAEPGPFRITAKEWTEAINGIAKDLKLVEADRLDWRLQSGVAALRAADAARKMKPDLGDFPTYTELYFGQRLGDPAAAAKILKGDRTLKCKDVITDAVAQGSTHAAALKAGSQSVAEALADLKKGLVEGLAEALKIIDEMPPDIRFFRPNETDAPWMAVALQEEAREVAELPGEQSNERIVLYHKAAGVTSQADTDTIPWCASFVTFCMRESGIPEIEVSPPEFVDGKGPAWAPRWDTWGKECNPGDAPVGAVITVKTTGAETGHVGFLAALEEPGAQFIQLLGGNQGARDRSKPDQVNTTRFPVASIMHRRWLTGAWGGVGPGITGAQFRAIFDTCPNPDVWARAITDAWRRFKIVSKAARAGFLGITGNETGGFTRTGREDMVYTPGRAAVVFSKARESADVTATKIAAGERAFANWIYADRNGNGGEASGDGWEYRGTGIIQLTGRGNFELCAHKAQLDIPRIVDDPDEATDPALSARIAAWYMHNRQIIDGIGGDDVQFTSAALKVGLPPDDAAKQNRLAIRARAMANLT